MFPCCPAVVLSASVRVREWVLKLAGLVPAIVK
jgi:hypothetical protein